MSSICRVLVKEVRCCSTKPGPPACWWLSRPAAPGAGLGPPLLLLGRDAQQGPMAIRGQHLSTAAAAPPSLPSLTLQGLFEEPPAHPATGRPLTRVLFHRPSRWGASWVLGAMPGRYRSRGPRPATDGGGVPSHHRRTGVVARALNLLRGGCSRARWSTHHSEILNCSRSWILLARDP